MEKQPARVWSHCAGTFPKELQEGNLSPKKKSVRRRTAGNQEPESGSEQGRQALHRWGGEGRWEVRAMRACRKARVTRERDSFNTTARQMQVWWFQWGKTFPILLPLCLLLSIPVEEFSDMLVRKSPDSLPTASCRSNLEIPLKSNLEFWYGVTPELVLLSCDCFRNQSKGQHWTIRVFTCKVWNVPRFSRRGRASTAQWIGSEWLPRKKNKGVSIVLWV